MESPLLRCAMLTRSQEQNLIRLAATAARYKLTKVDDLLKLYGVSNSGGKKTRSDALKKSSRDYYLSGGRVKTAQQYGDEQESYESLVNRPVDFEDTPPLDARQLSETADGDMSAALSESIIQLKALLQTLAQVLYGVTTTESQALKLTKETLKIISARIADIPISDAVDAIDRYLDKLEKKGVPPPGGSVAKLESDQAPGMRVPENEKEKGVSKTAPGLNAPSSAETSPMSSPNPNELKTVPPWARI